MKRLQFCRPGQSTMEYAVLLAIVAAALIAMNVYVKRGIQGRLRDLADQISPTHYEQGRTESVYNTSQTGTSVQQYQNGVASMYQDGTHGSAKEVFTREGYAVVTPETQYQRPKYR